MKFEKLIIMIFFNGFLRTLYIFYKKFLVDYYDIFYNQLTNIFS